MEGKRDRVTTGEATSMRASGATFLGHPKSLFYLSRREREANPFVQFQ